MNMKHLAYYDTGHEFSEEIAMAAGLIPVKILGDVNEPNDPADRYIHNYICPFSRSCLTEGMKDSNKWSGIVFCHGCDTTNNQFDIWKRHVPTDFLYWISTPAKNDSTALDWHERELRRFISKLENHYSAGISDEKISEAISLSNKIKSLLRSLSELRATRDIPNREYFELVKRCVTEEKSGLVFVLKETLSDWESRAPFPSDYVPVLLTGSDITYGEVMDTLEAAKLRAVRDDLSIGERYFAFSIDETGDPVRNIVEYHAKIPQPPTKIPFYSRLEWLKSCLLETPVKGVVYQILKFCEPHGLDQPFIIGELKNEGYKVVLIEREYSPVADQQLVSRLESFREIIEQEYVI